MTASEINMTHSTDAHWENLVQTVNDLQNKVSLKQVDTVSALFQALVEQQRLPCITPQELSVVSRDYGQSQCTWVVHEGRVVTDADAVGLAADNQLILEVLDNNALVHYPTLSGIDACRQAGFAGYQSVLVVPMKLDDHRRLGAFVILNKTQPSAYSPEASHILDVLGDRVALLLKTVQRQVHEEESSRLEASLLHGALQITRECQILEQTYHSIRQRYPASSVYCLVKNPLDTGNYYLASDAGQDALIRGFRLTDTLMKEELYNIVGGEASLQTMVATNFQYGGAFATLPSPAFSCTDRDVMSWLGATIYHAEGTVLGHFILHNKVARYAYDKVDQHLLNDACKITGASLSYFRRRQKEKIIAKLSDIKDENALYTEACDYLQTAYGVKSLLIYAVNTATQDWGVKFQNGIFVEPDTVFRELVIKVAQEYRISPKDDERKKQYVEYPKSSGDKYVVVPMRTKDEDGDFRVVGCFVIPAQNQGIIATRIIDEVSDALAKRKKELDDDERQKKLSEYIKKVSKLSPNDLTTEKSLALAKEAIAEIMFSANLYFALYDQEKNEVSFPVIYKDGEPWEGIKNRSINPEKQGRTESIILTGKPILIKTLADSKAWYNPELNRQEFAGNPLASWVGVPIFNDKGVRGVIAVYHPDLDYVYSSKDLGFLENVAGAISTLFRMVEITEEKQNTEKVATQEGQILNNLLAIDVTHRLKGSLGSVSSNVSEAQALVDNINKKSPSHDMEQIAQILDDVSETTTNLLKAIKDITTTNKHTINIADVVREVIRQISIEYRMRDKLVSIVPNKEIKSEQDGRAFSTIVYSILENACQALEGQSNEKVEIELNANNNSFDIIIRDNGKEISQHEEAHLFELNFSTKEHGAGYALWRAKTYAKHMGGHLIFYREGQYKCFKLTMPTIEAMPLAYVIDDERIWRNSLSRWLSNMNYQVKTAGSLEEAHNLINQETNQVDLVLLDVSMNYIRGSNVDGLSLIEPIKKMKIKPPKIILITGYSGTAKQYGDVIDGLLDKVDDAGIPLNNESFKEKINSITQSKVV
ncbi:GAF domain-containing protein [Thiothrix sp.]|jgi:signal transduction histidine kinase|uniref:GAF domain-containing sensor histidine kinase n=1 Tax=Thiothrix sp. TaxID=1032 RepID=UPI002580AC83|nr:GAF domain-containing protein [Thiothrix sp.]